MKRCCAAGHILVDVSNCTSVQTHGAEASLRHCLCQLMRELWSLQAAQQSKLEGPLEPFALQSCVVPYNVTPSRARSVWATESRATSLLRPRTLAINFASPLIRFTRPKFLGTGSR
jgi:hypothetical protein